jgi:chemotaxis protein MotB
VRRRLDSPGILNIWPAFTDVLAGLVVVLVFLATVFVIGEVLIGREVYNKDTAIHQLRGILDSLEALLGDSEAENRSLKTRIGTLQRALSEQEATVQEVRAELGVAKAERQRLRVDLADAKRRRERLQAHAAQTDGALASATDERDRLQAALAAREAEYQTLEEDNRRAQRSMSLLEQQVALLSARAERLTAELERLNRALYGAREQLTEREAQLTQARTALDQTSQQMSQLQGELTARDASLAARETLIAEQRDRIAEMDRLIKKRLLERVEELEQYASEFFGRLREVFANNPDIKVVGDRFVFQSEVLFRSGQARLTGDGKTDLDKFVEVYRQVANHLPPDLPVVIEVQGHTDRVPIHTSRFDSNWSLSTARALVVVDYLIRQGIPPQQLAATGMGEYHPIDPGESPEALRRNRRIELKITSR